AIYGVPMPVQPMKSIAAVAISYADFNVPEVMASGICTAGILLVLGLTGLMKLVYKLIPISIVRGIQLAQGLSFAMTAVKYIRNVQNFSKSKSGGESHWLRLDGLLLAIICACFIIVVNGAGDDSNNDTNYTDENDRGAGNRGCWFGAIPCCYGAGGLAGQYKFRGRSGGCAALLCLAELVFGIVLGSPLVRILDQFPVGVLGVLLLFAGIELAICSRDMNSKEDSFVMLICTAVSLVGSSAALGFFVELLFIVF
ncbi:hypothetical protein ACH5RR_041078, partial [Cinchona calisaya]